MFHSLAALLGMLICGLVLLQLGVHFWRSLQQMLADRRVNRLRVQTLNMEIEELRRRHTTHQQSMHGWEGFRKFRVDRITQECDDVRSIYLVPHDGKSLPGYMPGQYLTFSLRLPENSKPVVRCYSLSDAPGRPYYRCSIKKVGPPVDRPDSSPGLASTHMNETVKEGDLLDVKSPRGTFVLDTDCDTPIVLLGGGIGVTPMLSMLNTLAVTKSEREAILFYGVRHGGEHIFRHELNALCENHDKLQQIICYSNPLPSDVSGRDYDVDGRVTIEQIRERLHHKNCEFFLCGPPPFMESLLQGLKSWGVGDGSIHTEAFGPSAVKKTNPRPVVDSNGSPVGITFAKSQTTINWDPGCDSILDFAEAHDIEIESGCRAGNCGTCAVAVKSGEVQYVQEPSGECQTGTCLPCICVPSESMVLDA